jgi:acetyl esterase/lipase
MEIPYMQWLLALLALFNLASMIAVYSSRSVERRRIPWLSFFTSLLATELAWIWLPLQILIAVICITGGALDHFTGNVALLVLLVTWPGLAWSIWKSTLAHDILQSALRAGLGADYVSQIPPQRRQQLRSKVEFNDWRNPVGFKHPDVEVLRAIPYAPGGVRQQLDIYRPKNIPEEGCPVLLQIHGGAWILGDKGDQALPLMYTLASRGWICVAANYRLSPSVGFPTHLEDCKAALGWIRENGEKYGMNTDFVAVTGGSAGGHLSSLLGLTENRKALQPTCPDTDTSVQACIPFYGVYDFLVHQNQHPNVKMLQNFISNRIIYDSVQDNPELWELASPITQITPDLPPFMVIHGDNDTLASVQDGRLFSAKLREVSESPVVYAELPGTEHAFEIVRSLRTEETIDAVHCFLEWALERHNATQAEPTPAQEHEPEQTTTELNEETTEAL